MNLQAEAEAWLTEALNQKVELLKEKEEYVEEPLVSHQ